MTPEEELLAITGGVPIPNNENAPNEPEIVEHAEAAPEPDPNVEIEAKAKEMGWNPDYDGANKKSAKEFLEIGEKRAPILLKEKRKLESENDALRKYNESLVVKATETIKQQQADYEKRITELEKDKKKAHEDLDTQALEAAIDEQNKLKQASAQLTPPTPPIDPGVIAWADDNQDYIKKVQSDAVLLRYQDTIALANREELMKLAPRARFEEIQRKVMEDLPHKFGNPNQSQAPRVQPNNRTPAMPPSDTNKISISTLPKADKEGYDLVIKGLHFKTPEERKVFDTRFMENYKVMNNIK